MRTIEFYQIQDGERTLDVFPGCAVQLTDGRWINFEQAKIMSMEQARRGGDLHGSNSPSVKPTGWPCTSTM
jgi:hypothetical protein